jgi:hypothetical protein
MQYGDMDVKHGHGMDVKHGHGMDMQYRRAASICSLDMQLAHAAGLQHVQH